MPSDPTLYLYTSLTSGSRDVITGTSRIEGILKANKISFRAVDCATDEKARLLWARRSKGKKLPGLVKFNDIIAVSTVRSPPKDEFADGAATGSGTSRRLERTRRTRGPDRRRHRYLRRRPNQCHNCRSTSCRRCTKRTAEATSCRWLCTSKDSKRDTAYQYL